MIVEKQHEVNQARRKACVIEFPDRRLLKKKKDMELEKEIRELEKKWNRRKH